MIRAWHKWRARKLAQKLEVQQTRCELLAKAEREYASSYYTDKLHDAICLRVQIASALEHHKSYEFKKNV